jgi:oxygen-independent coproporphyrinogen III oxidase
MAPPPVRHVYVHIPFCTHICPYCAFVKVRNVPSELRGFLEALRREAEWAAGNFDVRPRTVFFGGGTPSALGVAHWRELASWWPFRAAGAEVTVEANPLTISADKAAVLRDFGVTRVSLGVQAFDAGTLRTLGRTHDAEGVRRTMGILRRAGFDNVNIDLMFNVPGQTRGDWRGTLREALALEPEHVSAYSLTYEEDTEFFDRLRTGQWRDDEDCGREMYGEAMEALEAAGFVHYEISNFARPGRFSAHNLACWRGRDYLGLGPGAVSTVAGRRWRNTGDNRAYVDGWAAGGRAPVEQEEVAGETRRREELMLRLRTRFGVGESVLSGQGERARELSAEGLIALERGRWRLTRRGRAVADSVTEYLWT